ncbi:dihydroorotate dehydrogenase electron transfer subunit [Peribacillus sp. SCS-155]|uniref:dihydroorotate dehydrogenase electron transfer subunit n=1 Tax=Peribacillus sedimenti TaxID=3115297 RepID=UPI003906C9FC
MIQNEIMKVVEQRELTESIFELTLQGSLATDIKEPGQFVHVKTANGIAPLLRRPISISSYDASNSTMTMIYRATGKGTKLLSKKKAGELVDILGPLGNGFPVGQVNKGESVVIVGGGIGVPPLYQLSKNLTEKGATVTQILGFQSREAVFYEQEFARLGDTYVLTADGSYGRKGFVTAQLEKLNMAYDFMYACGPTPMLRALEKNYGGDNLYLSLEERMGCGIGACFACVCHTADDPSGSSYRKVCSDGPVFRSGEVII